jgi:hypothetical protein
MNRKPFHESAVEAIGVASIEEIACIGCLLMITKIPKDHDKIICAWNARCKELDWHKLETEVAEDLLVQKKEAGAKVAEKASATAAQLDDTAIEELCSERRHL